MIQAVRGIILGGHGESVQRVCTPTHQRVGFQIPGPHPDNHGQLLDGGSGQPEEFQEEVGADIQDTRMGGG